MALLKDVRGHLELLSNDPFDRITPSVDARVNDFRSQRLATVPELAFFVVTRVESWVWVCPEN